MMSKKQTNKKTKRSSVPQEKINRGDTTELATKKVARFSMKK